MNIERQRSRWPILTAPLAALAQPDASRAEPFCSQENLCDGRLPSSACVGLGSHSEAEVDRLGARYWLEGLDAAAWPLGLTLIGEDSYCVRACACSGCWAWFFSP